MNVVLNEVMKEEIYQKIKKELNKKDDYFTKNEIIKYTNYA